MQPVSDRDCIRPAGGKSVGGDGSGNMPVLLATEGHHKPPVKTTQKRAKPTKDKDRTRISSRERSTPPTRKRESTCFRLFYRVLGIVQLSLLIPIIIYGEFSRLWDLGHTSPTCPNCVCNCNNNITTNVTSSSNVSAPVHQAQHQYQSEPRPNYESGFFRVLGTYAQDLLLRISGPTAFYLVGKQAKSLTRL